MRTLQTDFTAANPGTAGQAAGTVFAAASAFTGGIDYSQEKEITQDEMHDEMFAALRRGDVETVRGMASAGRMQAKPAEGITALVSGAQEKRDEIAQAQAAHDRLDTPYNDAGLGAILLFQTGGNAQLAKLLLAKLHTNYLMRLDGVMADEMAREMGSFALSEQLRQFQREKAAAIDEAEVIHTLSAQHHHSVSDAFVATFGRRTEEKPVPLAVENSSFLGRCCKRLGLSKLFGFASAKEEEAPAPVALAVEPEQGITHAVMGFVKRFSPSF